MHVDIPIHRDMRVGVTDYIMLLLLVRISLAIFLQLTKLPN